MCVCVCVCVWCVCVCVSVCCNWEYIELCKLSNNSENHRVARCVVCVHACKFTFVYVCGDGVCVYSLLMLGVHLMRKGPSHCHQVRNDGLASSQ